MAALGSDRRTLIPWITEGSRLSGTCTTRHKKTMRKKMRNSVKNLPALLAAWAEEDDFDPVYRTEEGGHISVPRTDFPTELEFFEKHVRPLIGQPPVYGSSGGLP